MPSRHICSSSAWISSPENYQAGVTKGVRLSPSSQPLTCCLYGDDLLIFGEATRREATITIQILEQLSAVSGQQIGSQKSSILFS